MTTLYIGNNLTDEIAGDLRRLTSAERRAARYGSGRLVWFAGVGDVLVLPGKPDDEYLDYVTAHTGTRRSAFDIVVPPPGNAGADVLSADRLANTGCHEAVRRALANRPVDNVCAMYTDAAVAALADALDCVDALPGHRFFEQGGSALANSKATFRAMAAEVGLPIPPGAVITDRQAAERAITELLARHHSVIVKRDFQVAGYGNEILSPVAGVAPTGAHRQLVLADRSAVRGYLADRWDWLTEAATRPVVIERYFPDSAPIYAEFSVTGRAARFLGHGEMLRTPNYTGVVIPAHSPTADQLAEFVENAWRMCNVFRAIGYRGRAGVDGIVTPDGDILLNEINGRIGGSSHLFGVVHKHIIGAAHVADRVLTERGGWRVPSFRAAATRLAEAGLAFDQKSRTGVLLICDFTPLNGTVRYCVVAESLAGVHERARLLPTLFALDRVG